MRSRSSGQVYAGIRPNAEASNYGDEILDAFEYDADDDESLRLAVARAHARWLERRTATTCPEEGQP